MKRKLHTISEIAEYFGVTTQAVRYWLDHGCPWQMGERPDRIGPARVKLIDIDEAKKFKAEMGRR